jgi:hypothetical protein
MKIISYSLYGNNPIYTIGAIKNAELHKTIFSDWEMRVYYNDTVSSDVIAKLNNLDVNTVRVDTNNGFVNSMWRFLPISEDDAEYVICRDTDSRISERDECAVREWIESQKSFHIIREHPIGHGWVMNAGMWGCKGRIISNIFSLMTTYVLNNRREWDKTIDQCFLRDIIYPTAKQDLFLHDEYFNYEKIGVSIKRNRDLDSYAFIGESVDENDSPRGDQRSPIIERVTCVR